MTETGARITLERLADGRWTARTEWKGRPDSGGFCDSSARTMAFMAQALSELDWQDAHNQRLPEPSSRYHSAYYASISTLYTSLNSTCTKRGPDSEHLIWPELATQETTDA